jgi:hypothetical protein
VMMSLRSLKKVNSSSMENQFVKNGESIVPGSAGITFAGLHVIQRWP